MEEISILRLTPLEIARADYQRALDALVAMQRATELEEKQALVGRFFKHVERLRDDTTQAWLVYSAITDLDVTSNTLQGWHFQSVPTGQHEIGRDGDLQSGFFMKTEGCREVTRGEFVTAFNALLTAIAHYATRLPA